MGILDSLKEDSTCIARAVRQALLLAPCFSVVSLSARSLVLLVNCLETGKSFRRSELNILVSLPFVCFFFFLEIAVAPLSYAETPARFPSENSIKRAGDYGKTLSLFPFPLSPVRFLFPLSPISLRQKRPLRRGEVVAHSDFLSEKNENLRVQSTLS